MALTQPLTPGQAAKVRSYIFGLLRSQIPLAHLVVTGEVTWSPTQARVFGQLLDKCIPDLSASFMSSDRSDGDLVLMSRRDLEALAAGAQDDAKGHRPTAVVSWEPCSAFRSTAAPWRRWPARMSAPLARPKTTISRQFASPFWFRVNRNRRRRRLSARPICFASAWRIAE